jgi:hypothetical protein
MQISYEVSRHVQAYTERATIIKRCEGWTEWKDKNKSQDGKTTENVYHCSETMSCTQPYRLMSRSRYGMPIDGVDR